MESKNRIRMKIGTFSCLSAVYLGLFLQICFINGVDNATTPAAATTTVITPSPTISTALSPTTTPTPQPSSKTPESSSTPEPTTTSTTNIETTTISTTDMSTSNETESTTNYTTPFKSTLETTENTATVPSTETTTETTVTNPSQSTSISIPSTDTTSPPTTGIPPTPSPSPQTSPPPSTPSSTLPPPPNDLPGILVGVIIGGIVIIVIVIFVGCRYIKTGSLKKTFIFKDPLDYQPSPPPVSPREPEDLKAFPRSVSIVVDELPDTNLEKTKNSGLLYRQEYGMISRLSPKHPNTVALIPENQLKNRYRDILPFDHNRVLLEKLDGEEHSDYVNASYIPGYKSDKEYIACQGPTETTINDHWRMIWEQNIRVIIMVTKCEEGDIFKREKCVQYWPDKDSKKYGDITVSVLSTEKHCRDNYKIRKLDVRNGVETRIVYHFQYIRWPDKQNPEDPDAMLEFRDNVRDTMLQFDPGPIVVHCSAGVGRSGTYIAIDILLQHMEDHDNVDVYGLVLSLRNSRVYMVQTPDQYMFVHSSLLHIMDTRRQQEVDDGNTYVNIMEDEYNPYENIPMAKKPEERRSLFSSGRKKKAVPPPIVSNSYKPVGDDDDEDSPPRIPTKPGQSNSETDSNKNPVMNKSVPIPTKPDQTNLEIDSHENRAMKKSPPLPPENGQVPIEIEGYENPALTASEDPIPSENGTAQLNNLESSTKEDNPKPISENDIVLTPHN